MSGWIEHHAWEEKGNAETGTQVQAQDVLDGTCGTFARGKVSVALSRLLSLKLPASHSYQAGE